MATDDARTEPTEPNPAENEAALAELGSIRQSIDNIDAALVHMLAERFKFTQKVGKLKAKHGLPPADPAREASQTKRLRALAVDAALDPAFAEKWFNFVVAEVIHHHERLAGEEVGGRTAEQNPDAAAIGGDAGTASLAKPAAITTPASPITD